MVQIMSQINTKTMSIDTNTQLIDVDFASCSTVSYVDFKVLNVGWEFY